MKELTCCFSGHRVLESPRKVAKLLIPEIENLISKGVIYFCCGGALGFDTLAAETVIKLRKKHKSIKLILILPCYNQDRYWDNEEKHTYKKIKAGADEVIYTSEAYYKGCMMKRNRELIDGSKYLVCYLRKLTGGTAYTVSYATRKDLEIINLADKKNKNK